VGFYLLDHPNPHGDHFYRSRRRPLLAQVIHITAGLEDLDLIGPDASAERTAHYAATTERSVSWHTGSDTDGWLDLLPYSFTAFQCVDYNSSTAGHEISKATTDWTRMDPEVRDRMLRHAAAAIRPKLREHGIPMRKTTAAELDRAIAAGGPAVGLLGHHELDPDRRTDPGLYGGRQTFPWSDFLAILREDDDDMSAADVLAIKNALNDTRDELYRMISRGQMPDGKTSPAHAYVSLAALRAQTDEVAGKVDAITGVRLAVDALGDDEPEIRAELERVEASLLARLDETHQQAPA
jgi:hypothetical protein